MPILTLQQRSRELGRIRIGQQVPTSDGKMRPEKLDRFRITSASRELIDRIAVLYGGEAREWDNHGSPQFEVITTSTRLPVLVPPQPVSQYFESWSAGGCQRRCDGVTELLKDKPCICGPDPDDRQCKPTTRLNVVLRDVEGIGVFRLESHGYHSAVELPEVAEFLARAGGYMSAWLSLEPRAAIRDGKTRRWMVPILEVDVTPAQLLSGNGPAAQVSSAPAAIDTGRAALPAGESAPAPEIWAEWLTKVEAAQTLDELRHQWRHRPAETLPADTERAFTAHAAKLRQWEEDPETAMEMAEAEAGMRDGSGMPSSAATGPDVDALWQQILTSASEDWTTQEIEHHFFESTGVGADKATAEDMQRYLDTRDSAAGAA